MCFRYCDVMTSLFHSGETHSLKTLHAILSTGSTLKPQSFDYVYRDIKKDVLLGSITGAYDLIAPSTDQKRKTLCFSILLDEHLFPRV